MPRFTVSDADLCAEFWYKWRDVSSNAESALQFACVNNEGVPVKAGVVADTVWFLLRKRGVCNPELFTMRDLRRVQSTILDQRSAPKDEKVAVGDWQQCVQRGGQGVSALTVLLDGVKVRTDAFTKHIQVEIVRRVSLCNPEKLDQVYQAAESAPEINTTVDEIPPELIPKWYQPTKQFFFSTDAVRAAQKFQAKKVRVDAKSDPVDVDALVEAMISLCVRLLGTKPSDVYWQLQGPKCTLLMRKVNLLGAVRGADVGPDL